MMVKEDLKGWTQKEEYQLLELLDDLNGRNIKFALSNVFRAQREVK
ncbi:hypothetical protein CCAN11_2350009 [Capnocytophaga canimorsus]|uniref:Uncharacterized protein n=1 Tax=Capnocytophaga canimorsus TaxID=28188 RepID=A0A0B7IIP4_9FLAO|nr:hypothetical protein CCAN11_2350009 [Capnocytophaga canimorsus]